MTTVRVACCQASLSIDDPERSWAGVLALVREAQQAGARLVVLPELATTGTVFRDSTEARAAADLADRGVRSLAEVCHPDGVIVAGTLRAEGELARNSAVVIDGGRIVGEYDKVHLWGEEKRLFAAADNLPLVVRTSLGVLGVGICYDAEFPEWIRNARQRGAQIMCVCANWPLLSRPVGERPLEVIKAQAAAGCYRIPVAIADRVGTEREVAWIGGSVVVGEDGYLRATARLGEECLIVTDIELATETSLGDWNDVLGDRRPDLYAEATD